MCLGTLYKCSTAGKMCLATLYKCSTACKICLAYCTSVQQHVKCVSHTVQVFISMQNVSRILYKCSTACKMCLAYCTSGQQHAKCISHTVYKCSTAGKMCIGTLYKSSTACKMCLDTLYKYSTAGKMCIGTLYNCSTACKMCLAFVQVFNCMQNVYRILYRCSAACIMRLGTMWKKAPSGCSECSTATLVPTHVSWVLHCRRVQQCSWGGTVTCSVLLTQESVNTSARTGTESVWWLKTLASQLSQVTNTTELHYTTRPYVNLNSYNNMSVNRYRLNQSFKPFCLHWYLFVIALIFIFKNNWGSL